MMTKKKVSEDKQVITIDGEDYAFDDLSDLQKSNVILTLITIVLISYYFVTVISI